MNKIEQINYIETNCPFKIGPHSKRRVRQNFFENIDTELQAYLLGFHAADGCCNPDKGTLRFTLQARDSEMIYMYKDYISPEARTFIPPEYTFTDKHTGRSYKRNPAFGIDIYSISICRSLERWGFGKNKTYKELHLPSINENLIRHFLRGYFDGDGCITWCVLSEKSRDSGRLKASVGFTSKTITLLEEIKTFLTKHDILSNIFYERKGDYVLHITKGQLPRLFDLLYKDANFYLKRKYEKFNHFVNTEVTQLIDEYRNAQKTNASESNNSSTSAEHPTGVNMCAELTGNCESSEIKSSEDNN